MSKDPKKYVSSVQGTIKNGPSYGYSFIHIDAISQFEKEEWRNFSFYLINNFYYNYCKYGVPKIWSYFLF